jgi:hypothetical protein
MFPRKADHQDPFLAVHGGWSVATDALLGITYGLSAILTLALFPCCLSSSRNCKLSDQAILHQLRNGDPFTAKPSLSLRTPYGRTS